MRSCLTGSAGAVTRRHQRAGLLVQTRYQSVGVEEAPSRLERVRDLHLKPLRAGLLPDRRTLARSPWTGPRALLGTLPRPGPDTQRILPQVGPPRRRAKSAYRTFVAEGLPRGRRPDLQGGGCVRSLAGWAAGAALRRGREGSAADDRGLGPSAVVAHRRNHVAAQAEAGPRRRPLGAGLSAVAPAAGLPPVARAGTGRRPRVARARAGAASLWGRLAGQAGRVLAAARGLSPHAGYAAAMRGESAASRWQRVWNTLQ